MCTELDKMSSGDLWGNLSKQDEDKDKDKESKRRTDWKY